MQTDNNNELFLGTDTGNIAPVRGTPINEVVRGVDSVAPLIRRGRARC
jgi:hypothetical protein